ncbi:hypothetical protein KIN20_009349 [Parelaphostrongylus tenuis]|uniref:NADPH:adrenodoxin oxidoreductase, mitochondrial n=1 Tax=Parelaphostrongylus tenuis TaxID=148309 RepID=A0AAD5M824_PARTN|nr:hypothetical protein KIN20_009349 [Parelaphostrongylus tenuis]
MMHFSLWRIFLVRASRSFSTATGAHVAIVGSGPAGLFTCASLLRRIPDGRFDVFDASPVPFGLIRYGVAPDHQEVKNCINGFDRMFESNRSRLSLFCNVRIGSDLSVEEMTKYYDVILLSYGAHHPRHLEIPGVESKNVMSGSDFVSWYNGVPKAQVPVLDDPNVVIIGNGNVALDCARILSTVKSLRTTDIPSGVLDILEDSRVTNIKIIGRRGPENVSFTIKELREQFKVPEWNTTVEMDVEQIEKLKDTLSSMDRRRKRLMTVLLEGVNSPEGDKQCRFLSFRIPEEIMANSDGRICAIRVLNNRTGAREEIPCGLLIYSIGYRTVVLEGIPVNDKGMIAMKDDCRVDMPCGSLVYATGWCAHGPRGVIVDTQQESITVANQIAADLSKKTDLKGSNKGAQSILDARGIKYITWDDWKKIDDLERKKGVEKGKIREKLTNFNGELIGMASLESKLLDGECVGYCSSSDEDEEGWKVVNDEDQHKAHIMRHMMTPSTNTGVKGVLNEFAAEQERSMEKRKAKDREIRRLAQRGMLQGSTKELENAQISDLEGEQGEEEETLKNLRNRRLIELRKAAAGRMVEIVEKDQFVKAIDTCDGLLCILIYKPDDEMCERATHVCKVLAVDYPSVRFVRARSTLLEMSKNFSEQALPTLQFYLNGVLVGNFLQISSLLGGEIDVDSVKKFLRRQHIDLTHGTYTTDSECSNDEDID